MKIGLEPLGLVPQKWKDWSPWELVLLSPRLVPWQNRVGALEVGASQKSKLVLGKLIVTIYILYLFYCKDYINKSIYSYCSFCVLNINVLTGKIIIGKEILIHPPSQYFQQLVSEPVPSLKA